MAQQEQGRSTSPRGPVANISPLAQHQDQHQQSNSEQVETGDMGTEMAGIREQILAAQAQATASGQPTTSQQHQSIQPQQTPPAQAQMRVGGQSQPSAAFAHEHRQHHVPQNQQSELRGPRPGTEIDPAISAQYGTVIAQAASQSPEIEQGSPESSGAMATAADGRRMTKRELSSSKRAAQNRAAQRAFRQRKEAHIKKLEDQVREATVYPALQEDYHRIQVENYHLREYIMTLQIRLQDTQGEFPAPPPGLDLRDPRTGEPLPHQDQTQQDNLQGPPTAPIGQNAVSQLQAAAAAAQSGDFGSSRAGGETYRQSPYPGRPQQQDDVRRAGATEGIDAKSNGA